jgi:hypothetical protein
MRSINVGRVAGQPVGAFAFKDKTPIGVIPVSEFTLLGKVNRVAEIYQLERNRTNKS